MLGIVLFVVLILIIIGMYAGGIIGWCLSKLRLLVPIIFMIVCIILDDKYPDWLITRILNYNLPFAEDFPVEDLIFLLLILYAVIMFFRDIFAPIIGKMQEVRLRKQQRTEMAIMEKQQKQAFYNAVLKKQEREQKEALVFSIMPDMEKEYYYFKNQCSGDEELKEYETDWKEYINEAHRRLSQDETDTYTFEEWYGDNDMWKKRSYNKEFLAKEREARTNQNG